MASSPNNRGGVALIAVVVAGILFGGFWLFRDQLRWGAGGEAEQIVEAQVGDAPQPVGQEACGVAIAGSNTIGEQLAPAVVSAFLRYNEYEVGPPQTLKDGEIRIVGVRGKWRCTVDVRSHGSGTSFEELVAGSAMVGMSSRAIRASEIDALKAAGAGDFAAEAAKAEHVVALDGIAIVVHPSNPLRQMTREDVKRVFLGDIKDWSALGVPFGAIKTYTRDDRSGTFQFFHENVLAKDPKWDAFKAVAARFESSSDLVAAVAADPKAIGFVGVAYVGPGVRTLNISDGGPAFAPTPNSVRSESYPISRRLYLYVRPSVYDGNNFVNALVNHFKSGEAYGIVQDLKYVSLQQMQENVGGVDTGPDTACAANTPEGEVYRAATMGAQRLSSVIRFLPGSNAADSLARDDIARSLPTLKTAIAEGAVVRLIGHSDDAGSAEVNRRLAMARADAIRLEYERQGVLGLAIESAGEMCPVAGNDTPQGRQSNRRVEIWVARVAG